MRRLAALAAALVVLAGCGDSSAEREPDRLPDITLAGLGDDPDVDLGELRGPVVVNLWASWCVPCKRELPIYADFAEQYAGTVDVLGIDFQETREGAALAMVRKSGVDYPNVSDPDGETRAIGLPRLILLDAEGAIAYDEYVEIKSLAELTELVSTHLGVEVPAA